MNEVQAVIHLDGGRHTYDPGNRISGEVRLSGAEAHEIRAVEISVMWYTEGKGEEDLAVHFFQRLAREEGDVLPIDRAAPFQTVLPATPLSYDGVLIKIRWCVRVRLFLPRGREEVFDEPFHLGHVPKARTPGLVADVQHDPEA